MNLNELRNGLQKTLEDNERLKKVERELEKARMALNIAEKDNLRLIEKISALRRKSKAIIDQVDEDNLFKHHAKFRFASHLNGVRALHVKQRGVGKMFTTREVKGSLLATAMKYLRGRHNGRG